MAVKVGGRPGRDKGGSAAVRSVLAVSDAAWAEAVRRAAVIRPLAAAPRLGKAMMAAAARRLGLSTPRVYGLVRVFRNHPVTAALLPTKSGPAKGARQLNPAVEARIEAAITREAFSRDPGAHLSRSAAANRAYGRLSSRILTISAPRHSAPRQAMPAS